MTLSSKLLLVLLLSSGLWGASAALAPAADDPLPPLPASPHAASVTLLRARPFTLDAPTVHRYRAEQPQVRAGVMLVLAVADRDLLVARQSAEPVLYVGAETAARVNHGAGSGRVVAWVPAGVDADGRVALDLTAVPIFFGDAELPERIDAAAAAAQLRAARAAGARAPTPEVVAAALEPQVRFADEAQLLLFASDLVEQWAPDEADLVAGLRAERLTR